MFSPTLSDLLAQLHHKMNPTREVILAELDSIYAGPAWHGPSMRESLDGIDAATAAKKPTTKRNSIWELVQHVTHGRHLLLERLENRASKFPRELREDWWPVPPAETTDAAWRKDLQLLDEYQTRLLGAIRAASDDQLARVPAGGDQAVARQLLGLAFHDAYHAGQIKLLALVLSDAGQPSP
jgi:uncharacterized damage-inducible protein DinB